MFKETKDKVKILAENEKLKNDSRFEKKNQIDILEQKKKMQ